MTREDVGRRPGPAIVGGDGGGSGREDGGEGGGANAAAFAWSRDAVFDRIARRYDLLCDVFSLGIHRLWKRAMARRLVAEDWTTLLDGATGTGDIILRVLARVESGRSGTARTVVAADVSAAMLAVARDRLAAHAGRVAIRRLDAERMPEIADASVDAYSLSLALKICDRSKVVAEARRVLRPGGRLLVLEASTLQPPWLNRAYLRYMAIVMPALGWLATGGDASAYRYLLRGIRGFPGAEALARELEAAGFEDVRFERLSLGIVAIHSARKPRRAIAPAG